MRGTGSGEVCGGGIEHGAESFRSRVRALLGEVAVEVRGESDPLECRSDFDTSASGTPAVSVSVAARWRRSCSRTRGSPASAVSRWT